ncbi:hypothetical protein BZA05DRAFT_406285 [Tricharina praecox]|uniref:uncharacterized protein n=1 Tax=Tricharina praecox TaxID=43433 RepID=UPI00222046E9|nr:uncharacterized protein BZA05DRAFT_406285 [Tricharina praecox]KAI5846677.1 hypothetical protein BZA05DRAFT_406285 [Tricharina praecox]
MSARLQYGHGVRLAGTVSGAGAGAAGQRQRQHHDPARQGKVVGGGSAINGMIFQLVQRGAPADYDVWAALRNQGGAPAGMLLYFLKTETSTLR